MLKVVVKLLNSRCDSFKTNKRTSHRISVETVGKPVGFSKLLWESALFQISIGAAVSTDHLCL